MTAISWNPLEKDLISVSKGIRVRLLIAPFVQTGAIKELFSCIPPCLEMKVITRWQANDILSGVSSRYAENSFRGC